MKEPFTVTQGLAIQEEHMDRWNTILSAGTYELLRDKRGMMNAALPKDATGYDVWRGQDLDNFLVNLSIKLAAGKTHAEAFIELA